MSHSSKLYVASSLNQITETTIQSTNENDDENSNSGTDNTSPIPISVSNTGKSTPQTRTLSRQLDHENGEDRFSRHTSLSKDHAIGSGSVQLKDVAQAPGCARTAPSRRWTNDSVLPSIREWHDDFRTSAQPRLLTSPSTTLDDERRYIEEEPVSAANRLGVTPSSGHAIISHDPASMHSLSPSYRNEESVWLNSDIQEACLMRYFIENLARWFDLCDPQRHFATIVPERARSCPPLLNAILTAAARHIYRLERYQTSHGIRYQGQILPNLSVESAIHYQNKCIPHLIQLSNNAKQVRDENLLAAAVILRFYEEVDAPLSGGSDSGVFLRVMNLFIDAQVPIVSPVFEHHSRPGLFIDEQSPCQPRIAESPSTDSTRTGNPSAQTNLRQAAFWVFLRQEIYNAFMKQRSIDFSLWRCEAFRSLSPADDSIWADRLVVFCADVLQYCYGPEIRTTERWDELATFHRQLVNYLPASFRPIYFQPADTTDPISVFASIWYLADCHVVGAQYIELARMLLAVYDPTISRLGAGAVAAQAALATELRDIVLRLCGIALSNRDVSPGLITACMGIAMCGEYFTDHDEQVALLGVLEEMERDHGWPTDGTVRDLMKSWGWE